MDEIVIQLEKKRIKYWITKLLNLCIVVFAIYMFFKVWWIGLCLIILTAIISAYRKKLRLEIYTEYQDTIIKNILDTHFSNVEYKPRSTVNKDDLATANLRNYGNLINSKETISGKYKDVLFTQCDVEFLFKDNKKDKNKEPKELFKGKWLSFEYDRDFTGEIQIHVNPDKSLRYKKYLEQVQFEDIEFNKSFKTYTNSIHDAFYIMTPPMIERFKRLRNESIGVDLDVCFANKRIFTTVESFSDSFKLNLFFPIKLNKIQKKVKNDVEDIKFYIDTLELNRYVKMR